MGADVTNYMIFKESDNSGRDFLNRLRQVVNLIREFHERGNCPVGVYNDNRDNYNEITIKGTLEDIHGFTALKFNYDDEDYMLVIAETRKGDLSSIIELIHWDSVAIIIDSDESDGPRIDIINGYGWDMTIKEEDYDYSVYKYINETYGEIIDCMNGNA